MQKSSTNFYCRYNSEFESPVVAAWFEGFDDVQIFIAPEGCKSRSLQEHEKHLLRKIKRYKLKVDQWKEIPVYKSTNKMSPGEKVENATSSSTLGLFLEADGMSEFKINIHGIHLHHRQNIIISASSRSPDDLHEDS